MPDLDTKTKQQYWAARRHAGLMEHSHRGLVSMVGRDCLDLLHRLSTQDLLKLQPGEGARTVLASDKGRIIDVLTVYRLADRLLLITSPERQADTLAWLDRYTFSEDSAATDVTASTGLLTLLGPKAVSLAQEVLGKGLAPAGKLGHLQGEIGGVPVTLAHGHEPLSGLYIFVRDHSQLPAVSEALRVAGGALGLERVGPAVYDILRIEAGMGVYGREYGEQYNPLEAQLRDSISFHKGCYIGQEVIARLDSYQKVQKLLMGVLLPSGDVPPAGTRLVADGKDAGAVTSATVSPLLGRPIGLAYIAIKFAQPGTSLQYPSGGGLAAATVVDLPFTSAEAPSLVRGPR